MSKSNITVVIPLGENRENTVLNSLKKQKDKVRTIFEVGPNPSKNRNIGASKAKTNFIGFMNGHTIAAGDWSINVLKFFEENPEIDIVGGPQINHRDESFFAKTSGYALSSFFGAANLRSRYSVRKPNLNADETLLTSANLICKKEVIKKIKFDEKIYPGEDPKFIADAKKTGFRVAYSPSIITYNLRRTSFEALAKQIFGYGKVRPQKEALRETLKRPFFLVPSLFVIYLFLIFLLFAINTLFILPLITYIALDFLFSIFVALKNNSLFSVVLLLFIFPTIHISYGLGFLYGLLLKIEL